MTVQELIEHLETYQENAEVLYCADKDGLAISWKSVEKYNIYYNDINNTILIG